MATADDLDTSVLAPLACINCRNRKKGCDKKLPACSHCVRRSVACYYVASTAGKDPTTKEGPNSHPALLSGDIKSWSYLGDHESSRLGSPSIKSTLILAASLSDISSVQGPSSQTWAEPISFDAVLQHQVSYIIRAYGRYFDEIGVRYFEGVHRWLPIVSRNRFNAHLLGSQAPTSGGFSVLLLAMCLITSHRGWDSQDKALSQEELYLTTKLLFAHALAVIPLSTSLVQAALLITTYEYAHGLGDAAVLSISNCSRMAFTMGMDQDQSYNLLVDDPSTSRHQEERNLWWGIVVCERFVMSETPSAARSLATTFPHADKLLPVEVNTLELHNRPGYDSVAHQSVSSLGSDGIGSFAREAQAAYLHTRMVEITQALEPPTSQSELRWIDDALQKFLEVIIDRCGSAWGLYCGSIAFTIGAFFALHQYIVDRFSRDDSMKHLYDNSKTALDAAARMVVDVARSFNKNAPSINVEILPPRCSHLVQAAKHLYLVGNTNQEIFSDICEIRTMLLTLSKRWRIAEKQLKILDTSIDYD